jgi:hypothetical protein
MQMVIVVEPEEMICKNYHLSKINFSLKKSKRKKFFFFLPVFTGHRLFEYPQTPIDFLVKLHKNSVVSFKHQKSGPFKH